MAITDVPVMVLESLSILRKQVSVLYYIYKSNDWGEEWYNYDHSLGYPYENKKHQTSSPTVGLCTVYQPRDK